MTPDGPQGDSLTPSQEGRVDTICDRFEAAWKAGGWPLIEQFLGSTVEPERRALFAQLLALELELRGRRGERPGPQSYLARFPLYAELIREILGDTSTPADATATTREGLATSTFNPDQDPDDGSSSTRIVESDPRRWATPTGKSPGAGGYDILREIARGSMGIVYEARQRALGRTVALKMIQSGVIAGGAELRRFEAEVAAAARLEHPHIVPVFDHGDIDGLPYFTMAYIEGKSLADLIKEGPLAPRRAVELVREAVQGVQHAHDRGVVHRDLKPSNILVDPAGRARVTDFGLAKRHDADSSLTQSGAILGTPSFMAPEQARGDNDLVDARSDVYGLGATLYNALTGRPPFRASTPIDTLRQVSEDEPVPPRRLNSEVDRDLETIALKCLEKEPAHRYASAAALADDLGRWGRGEPVAARRPGPIERGLKWGRRHPALAALATVTAIAATVVIALILRDLQRGRATIAAITKERNDARIAERKADDQRIEADTQREAAERESKANRRRLVRSSIANGDRLVADGNPLIALPWYVHALQSDPDGPDAERAHRLRIGSLLAWSPKLIGLETGRIDVTSAGNPAPTRVETPKFIVPDGRIVSRVIASSGGGHSLVVTVPRSNARGLTSFAVYDNATKKPLFSPRDLAGTLSAGAFLDGSQRVLTIAETRQSTGAREDKGLRSEIRLWDATTGEPIGEPRTVPLGLVQYEANRGGDRLLIRGQPVENYGAWTCMLLDAATLKMILADVDGAPLRLMVFSPDGVRVAAVPEGPASPEQARQKEEGNPRNPGPVARIFLANDGTPIGGLMDLGREIQALGFLPNSPHLVTSGSSRVRLWRLPEGVSSSEILAGVDLMNIGPDGRILLRTGAGAPQVWHNPQGRLIPVSPPLPAAGWSPTSSAPPVADEGVGITPSWRSADMGSGAFWRGRGANQAPAIGKFATDGSAVVVTTRDPLANTIEVRTWHVGLLKPPRLADIFPGLTREGVPKLSNWIGPKPPGVRVLPTTLSMLSEQELGPDGRTFATYDTDRSIVAPKGGRAFQLVDVATGTRLGDGPDLKAEDVLILYSADARRILVVSTISKYVRLQSLFAGAPHAGMPLNADIEFRTIEVPSLRNVGPPVRLTGISAVALSPNGRELAVMTGEETGVTAGTRVLRCDTLRVFDLDTGEPRTGAFKLPERESSRSSIGVDGLIYSPDGQRILARRAELSSWMGGKYEIPPAHLVDARTLLSVGPPLSIPRTVPASPLQSKSGGDRRTGRFADFSPDGRHVAFSDRGNVVGIFESETGRAVGRTPIHNGAVRWIRFAPSGDCLATVGDDELARLWETNTGRPIGPPMMMEGVDRAEFSPDSSILFTSGNTGRLRAWNAATAEPISMETPLNQAVIGLIIAGDPLRAVVLTKFQAPVEWVLPIENRSKEVLTDLAVVLSGHAIEAEGVVRASYDRVAASRDNLLKLDPHALDPP